MSDFGTPMESIGLQKSENRPYESGRHCRKHRERQQTNHFEVVVKKSDMGAAVAAAPRPE